MACLVASVLGTGKTIHYYHIAQLFDEENIDGQHPRLPVLAILLEIIERKFFDALLA